MLFSDKWISFVYKFKRRQMLFVFVMNRLYKPDYALPSISSRTVQAIIKSSLLAPEFFMAAGDAYAIVRAIEQRDAAGGKRRKDKVHESCRGFGYHVVSIVFKKDAILPWFAGTIGWTLYSRLTL